MGRMPKLVERGKKDRRLGEPSGVSWEEIEALELDPRVELIRQLIPLGLAEVGRLLEEEVEQLAGRRHARKAEDDRRYRHGHNPGSVRLGGQRHAVRVPRVRGPAGESKLESYERLRGSAGEVDEGLFRKVLLGISCRDYEAAVEAVRSIGVVAKPNRSIRKRASHLPIEMAEVRRVGKPLRADNPPPESEEFESGPPVPSRGLIFVRPWEVHLRRDYDIPVEVYASGEYSPIVLSVKFTEAGPSEMVGMISLPVLGGSTQG